MAQANYKEYLNRLENTLNEYFGKKAPALPQNIKGFIVKIAPYLAILLVIFSIPAILAILGLGSLVTMLGPMNNMPYGLSTPMMWINTLALISVTVLNAMAIRGLFSKTEKAWRYMYWAQLIQIIAALLLFNIVGAFISAIIGFYILFQIKSFYK